MIESIHKINKTKKYSKYIKKAISIILIAMLTIYIGHKIDFKYGSICGTGFLGIKMLGIVIGIILFTLAIFDFNKKRYEKIYCLQCSAEIEDNWEICPYCGIERRGENEI
ncbi:hypothetical protein [Geosporobacter ferrireducens]|uniref:Zinc-ribbon domain-containing protein n=1 Tax=Geosporobacter ferrireducens TaxID=1424294 RepID=A0A1D8GE26_9FIRM|nr:hypothetical protein [Geosporobacter ferrireducens]AOT69142.1 hypothetical protein Gferi_05945 [Geosporobacter ferrireducens]